MFYRFKFLFNNYIRFMLVLSLLYFTWTGSGNGNIHAWSVNSGKEVRIYSCTLCIIDDMTGGPFPKLLLNY